jgi:CRISPR-associated endonuclease/helicase Cas3
LAAPPKPDPDATGSERRAEVGEWLASTVEGDGTWAKAIRDSILAGTPSRPRCRMVDIGDGLVAVIATRRVALSDAVVEDDPVSDVGIDDDDSRSFTGDDVTLTKHLSDVASLAESFAQHLNLPDDLVRDLRSAGALHDVGKADPRFQQMLAGGSELRVALQEALLAKSRGESRDRAARDEARSRSGYPRGYRHELASLAMVEGRLGELGPIADPDLVLHLIASHHGWCRPFAPASDPGPGLEVEMQVGDVTLVANAAHELAKFDSGVADRYFRLTERYGWWGLAWLESILRLADHRASEAPDGESDRPNEVARGVQC